MFATGAASLLPRGPPSKQAQQMPRHLRGVRCRAGYATQCDPFWKLLSPKRYVCHNARRLLFHSDDHQWRVAVGSRRIERKLTTWIHTL
jgi:hypothetical protein